MGLIESCDMRLTTSIFSTVASVAFIGLGQSQVEDEFNYKNGDSYKGSVINSLLGSGVRTGFGVYTWKDGKVYEGMWKDGERHGKGEQTSPLGDRYIGGWKNGKRNGQGVHNFQTEMFIQDHSKTIDRMERANTNGFQVK